MDNKEKKWEEIDILEYFPTDEEIINVVKILTSDEESNGKR
jgi:hypothetical protein